MLLRENAEQTIRIINPSDGKSNPLTDVLLRVESKHRNLLAVQVFVNGIDGILDDIFVPSFAALTSKV